MRSGATSSFASSREAHRPQALQAKVKIHSPGRVRKGQAEAVQTRYWFMVPGGSTRVPSPWKGLVGSSSLTALLSLA
jgi:hypothetical protein